MSHSIPVETFQENVEKLILSIFNASRAHEEIASMPSPQHENLSEKVASEKAADIARTYEETISNIDELIGINRTQGEQEEEMRQLSALYGTSRTRVLQLELQLKEISKNIDQHLVHMLEKEDIGLAKNS